MLYMPLFDSRVRFLVPMLYCNNVMNVLKHNSFMTVKTILLCILVEPPFDVGTMISPGLVLIAHTAELTQISC